jgi:glucose-6-phosphate 1-epimerase
MGAQVLSWTPTGGADVLWLSPTATLDGSRGIRGGVPICWPWFAEHPTDRSQPFHGIARTVPWDPVGAEVTEEAVRLAFELPNAANRALPLKPRFEVEIARTLRMTLVTRNTGAQDIRLTEALHSYFAVGDVTRTTVEGLADVDYLDKVEAFARKRQRGPIDFNGETDRIYLAGGAQRIVDPVLNRCLRISTEGSGATVVWNPAAERAAKMADIPGDTWRSFVCVETANAADKAVVVPAGGEHRLVAEVAVG